MVPLTSLKMTGFVSAGFLLSTLHGTGRIMQLLIFLASMGRVAGLFNREIMWGLSPQPV